MALKLGHFRKQTRNTWKDLKCGAGERWRRSIGPIVLEMKKCYKESHAVENSFWKRLWTCRKPKE
jgi:hypothetical protein